MGIIIIGLVQCHTSLAEIPLFPPIRKKTCITNHGEVFIGDVADESTYKSVNLQGHEGGLCTLGIVLIGKADDFTVLVDDTILSHDGSFCITTDVLNTETWIEKRSANMSVPG